MATEEHTFSKPHYCGAIIFAVLHFVVLIVLVLFSAAFLWVHAHIASNYIEYSKTVESWQRFFIEKNGINITSILEIIYENHFTDSTTITLLYMSIGVQIIILCRLVIISYRWIDGLSQMKPLFIVAFYDTAKFMLIVGAGTLAGLIMLMAKQWSNDKSTSIHHNLIVTLVPVLGIYAVGFHSLFVTKTKATKLQERRALNNQNGAERPMV